MKHCDVTAYFSTKGRSITTLPLAVISVACQTLPPKCIVIYDDNPEHEDLRKNNIWFNIFQLIESKGIEWSVEFGVGKGQVLNHIRALNESKTEWVWRVDDDDYVEADCLENLMRNAAGDVGAVGGLVLFPYDNRKPMPKFASNRIEDTFWVPTIQWFRHVGVTEVEHLHSTFIYRKKAGLVNGYCTDLSPVGHREETIFSYGIKRAGWRILVDGSAITWHMRDKQGGIRSYGDAWLWEHDDKVYSKLLETWGVKSRHPKLVVLDCGLGDHIVFKKILPEVKKKYSDLILSVCYPELFEDDKSLNLISIFEATMLGGIEDYNIYKFMQYYNWKDTLENAFRKMYLE